MIFGKVGVNRSIRGSASVPPAAYDLMAQESRYQSHRVGRLDILRHNVFSSQEFLSAQSSQSLINDKAAPTAGPLSFVTDMTLRVESHSPIPIDVLPHESVCVYLQPVINLFRYGKGAIIQHRPEDLDVGSLQCQFGSTGS